MLTGGGKRDELFHGLSIIKILMHVSLRMIRIVEIRNFFYNLLIFVS